MQEPCLGKVLPALRNSHLRATEKLKTQARAKKRVYVGGFPRGRIQHDAVTLGRPPIGFEGHAACLFASGLSDCVPSVALAKAIMPFSPCPPPRPSPVALWGSKMAIAIQSGSVWTERLKLRAQTSASERSTLENRCHSGGVRS